MPKYCIMSSSVCRNHPEISRNGPSRRRRRPPGWARTRPRNDRDRPGWGQSSPGRRGPRPGSVGRKPGRRQEKPLGGARRPSPGRTTPASWNRPIVAGAAQALANPRMPCAGLCWNEISTILASSAIRPSGWPSRGSAALAVPIGDGPTAAMGQRWSRSVSMRPPPERPGKAGPDAPGPVGPDASMRPRPKRPGKGGVTFQHFAGFAMLQ